MRRSTRPPQVGQPGSVFEHYRQLIELRHADPVVTDGAFELLLPDHPAIWAFLRRGPGAELLVAANFSAEVVSAALPLDGGWAGAAVLLSSLTGPGAAPCRRPACGSGPGNPSSGAASADQAAASADRSRRVR